jgi:hypothetical protein
MRGNREARLQALRFRYNAALAGHQGCMRALTEAAMAGSRPPAPLVESEARARQELERARERLLAAITEAITGQPAERAPGAPPPAESSSPDPSTPC